MAHSAEEGGRHPVSTMRATASQHIGPLAFQVGRCVGMRLGLFLVISLAEILAELTCYLFVVP